MAWIESYQSIPIPGLSIPVHFTREAVFRDYLWDPKHWPNYFGFEPWVREYNPRRGSKCQIDLIGESEEWAHGYLIELKLGRIESTHLAQARRYVKAMQRYKSWGYEVMWHPLVVAYHAGHLQGVFA